MIGFKDRITNISNLGLRPQSIYLICSINLTLASSKDYRCIVKQSLEFTPAFKID